MRATVPDHLFLLDLITGKKIFSVEWNSESSSSREENFLFSEALRPVLGPAKVKHASSY
jgi:hypothetical protein